MMRFLLQRIGAAALLLAGVSVLAFGLFALAPGEYLDEMKVSPEIPAETVQRVREQFGLDQPLPVRYGRWALSALRGEFGVSLAYGLPVAELIGGRARNTMLLGGLALLLSWGVAIPMAVSAAARPGALADRAGGAAASLVNALPDILVGLALLIAALRWGWQVPGGSLGSAIVALALVSFPAIFRHTRSSMREVLCLPFIEHLRACGVPERRILFRHALPVALNPLISLFGLSLGTLTSSSLVIEVLFGWPGLGPLLLEAILARDVAVVLAAVLLSGVFLIAGNLAADLLLYAADPRIRRGRS